MLLNPLTLLRSVISRTRAALPLPVCVDVRVLYGKLVSPKTVRGTGESPTGSLLTRSILHVILVGSKKEMIRPDAYSVVTPVAHEEAIWDRPVGEFIGEPVRPHGSIPTAPSRDGRVPTFDNASMAFPAPILAFDYVRPEPVNHRATHLLHVYQYSRNMDITQLNVTGGVLEMNVLWQPVTPGAQLVAA